MNVFAKSQTIIGKFLRSLYVGRITEYLWWCEEEELAMFSRSSGIVDLDINYVTASPVSCALVTVEKYISMSIRSKVQVKQDIGSIK